MIDTSLDSFNFYFFIASIQGFILAAIILSRKPILKPNIFLGALIFFFSLSLLHLILESSIHAFNSKFPVPMEFSFAYGPLAYLHTLSLKYPKATTGIRTYLHFLPSVLVDGLFFTGFFIYVRFNEEWAYANLENIQAFALSVAAVGLTQLGIYTYLIYKESLSIDVLPKEFPAIRKWFRIITISWVIMIVFLTIAVPVALINIDKFDDNSHLIYWPLGSIIGLFIYSLGYIYLIKYSNPVNQYISRTSNIRFTPQQMEERKNKLLKAIQNERLFQDQKLSVGKLARHMKWPINDVSMIINESMATNFNDLINEYRVAAFKEMASPSEIEKYSILGIANEAGFGSKASFYRAFKKETGITPTEYLKSHS